MFKSCTQKYTDESDEHIFRFTFYCDQCGKPTRAKPIAFSETDAPVKTKPEKHLWKMMWQKEHAAAFGRADNEVRNKLFQCPCCFEYVCEDCTRCVQTPDGGIKPRCKRCWGKKHRSEPFGFVTDRIADEEDKP